MVSYPISIFLIQEIILISQSFFSAMVGRKIKKLRKELNLSQKEFCAYLEVNQSQLSKIERGLQSVTICQLCWLAYSHKIDIEWFFNDIKIEIQKARLGDPFPLTTTSDTH